MSLKDWGTRLIAKTRTTVNTTAQPTTAEQMRKVMDDAEHFDKLIALTGWELACKFMISDVQQTISEASNFKYEKEKMTDMVVRWDAKRELVDGLMAYIGDMQKERDRLIEVYRGQSAEV